MLLAPDKPGAGAKARWFEDAEAGVQEFGAAFAAPARGPAYVVSSCLLATVRTPDALPSAVVKVPAPSIQILVSAGEVNLAERHRGSVVV